MEPRHPVIVCAAVIIQAEKILISQRPTDKKLGGFWEFPGGKLEAGESPQQALIREIKEELDIVIEVDDILEVVHHRYDWGDALLLAYLCRWQSGTIRHLEVADHRWLAADELADYDILPADQPILDKLVTRFSTRKENQ